MFDKMYFIQTYQKLKYAADYFQENKSVPHNGRKVSANEYLYNVRYITVVR